MFNCSCLLYKQHYLFALLVYVGICGLPSGIATGAKGEGAEHYWGGVSGGEHFNRTKDSRLAAKRHLWIFLRRAA